MIKITYLNVLDNQRHILLDELTLEEANLVMTSRIADPKKDFYYMPGLRVEFY